MGPVPPNHRRFPWSGPWCRPSSPARHPAPLPPSPARALHRFSAECAACAALSDSHEGLGDAPRLGTVTVQLQRCPEKLTTACVSCLPMLCRSAVTPVKHVDHPEEAGDRWRCVLLPPEHNDPRTNAPTFPPHPRPRLCSPDPLLAHSTGALTSYIATSRAHCEHRTVPHSGPASGIG